MKEIGNTVWDLTCIVSWYFSGKPFPQCSHLCGFTPRWTFMWDLRLAFLLKPLWQIWHLKGRSNAKFVTKHSQHIQRLANINWFTQAKKITSVIFVAKNLLIRPTWKVTGYFILRIVLLNVIFHISHKQMEARYCEISCVCTSLTLD
jgi:hypothetical protein